MLETELAAAFKQMLDAPHGIDKIEWWLQFAHSNERWLQFELGFWLSRQLGNGFAVGCEQQRFVDFVIFERKPGVFPLSDNVPIANLELKVQGNWYATRDVFPKIAADINKTETCGQAPLCRPGIALVVWFFVVPNISAHPYRWITEQVGSGFGLESPEAIEATMRREFGDKFQKISSWKAPDVTADFDIHEAHLYCFQNEAARQSPHFCSAVR